MIGVGTTIFLVNPTTFGGSAFTNDYSLLFDGVDEDVDMGRLTMIEGATSFSFSGWVKPLNTSGEQRVHSSYSSSGNWIELNVNGGNMGILINGTSGFGNTTTTTMSNGNWYHVCYVYDGTQTGNANRLKAWINGTSQTISFTGTIGATSSSPTGNLHFANGFTLTRHSNLYIDESAFFDYALTSGQVTSLYNSGTPTDLDNTSGVTAPVHWWRMGDGDTFPTINDVGTTGGNNGTMTNMEAGDIVTDTP